VNITLIKGPDFEFQFWALAKDVSKKMCIFSTDRNDWTTALSHQ
jgi:hypothetical protein